MEKESPFGLLVVSISEGMGDECQETSVQRCQRSKLHFYIFEFFLAHTNNNEPALMANIDMITDDFTLLYLKNASYNL